MFWNFFLFLSVFCCLVSYLNYDPMKSSFFLIFSMIFCMPGMVFFNYTWFSYFICMLFLSGIFVILVYFSSMSSLLSFKPYLYVVGFFLTLLLFFFVIVGKGVGLGLNLFYYTVNVGVLVYLVFVLLFFMNFLSYYMGFSGALRSI
uniref:NADH dehydrogenase subunit 6 n=1 Tax=Metastrongylus salmi TaxID=55276 RepID=D3J846_METSL|nr:NADH dehydrogenase subunit 6 [Metastrongylus salmi]ACX85145.1 NADH dehydrogenase subunit 6 [Metastrongylus salmi]